MKRKLSNSELIVFCEQMGMILTAGLSQTEGVTIMREDAGEEETELRQMYEQILEELEETGIFYEALKETGAFPGYMLHMVQIGEQTGNLDEVMLNLASYYEREEAMIQDIKSAVTYPLLMLGMMLIILLVMIIKVLPVFSQVYAQLGSRLTGPAAVLLGIGQGIREHYVTATGIVLIIAVGIIWLLCTDNGKKNFRRIASRFFGTRHIINMMSRARFTAGMSMALRSGMDYEGAFLLVESLVENDSAMVQKVAECKKMILEGEPFSQSASEAGILTGLNARMLHIAERTGETDEALQKIAVQIDTDITTSIQNFVSVLEPTLVAVLSILVGGILLSVMVPLMGVLSAIG